MARRFQQVGKIEREGISVAVRVRFEGQERELEFTCAQEIYAAMQQSDAVWDQVAAHEWQLWPSMQVVRRNREVARG